MPVLDRLNIKTSLLVQVSDLINILHILLGILMEEIIKVRGLMLIISLMISSSLVLVWMIQKKKNG